MYLKVNYLIREAINFHLPGRIIPHCNIVEGNKYFDCTLVVNVFMNRFGSHLYCRRRANN